MAYRGAVATIRLGDFGLLTDRSPADLPLGALIEAKNIIISEGLVQKAPGARIYNPNNQLAKIVALFDWQPDIVTQRMIAVCADGNIYRDTGDGTFNSSTAIATGLTNPSPRSQFIPGGNETAGRDKRLFLFTDGENQLKVLVGDGTSFSDISKPAADWTTNNYPRCGVTHRNRFWAFQDQRAYASDTGDHENFQSNFLTQNIFPGEGGDIVGAYVFQGRLFAFKEGEFVYYLDDSSADSEAWFWRKLSSNFGLTAPNAITNPINDLFVGNSTGTVTSYRATEKLGDVESSDVFRLAQMERFLRRTTHPSGLGVQHAVYDEELKRVYFTYRSTYTTENDMLICIDLNRDFPRITYLEKGSPTCLALYENINDISRPIYGGADGYVYLMNDEDRLEGTASYEGAFQTAFTDFKDVSPELAVKQKHFDYLWVEFVEEGDFDLSIDVYIDGKYIETTSTKMQLSEDYAGEFLLGTDRLGQYTTLSNPIPLHGMGRRISFRCYNAGSNQSFQIASLTVGFRPAHEGFSIF